MTNETQQQNQRPDLGPIASFLKQMGNATKFALKMGIQALSKRPDCQEFIGRHMAVAEGVSFDAQPDVWRARGGAAIAAVGTLISGG